MTGFDLDELPDNDEPTEEQAITWAEDELGCRHCGRALGGHPDDLLLSRICAGCDAQDIDPWED